MPNEVCSSIRDPPKPLVGSAKATYLLNYAAKKYREVKSYSPLTSPPPKPIIYGAIARPSHHPPTPGQTSPPP